jgi:hypothetical protein
VRLNASRAITTRLRDWRTLVVYSVLHAGMAGGLSTGFTVFIQSTYRNTLDPPEYDALVGFCPMPLRDFCARRNQLDLGLAQLLFFMSTALGASSAMAAVSSVGGRAGQIAREAAGGLSPAAFAVGRLAADALFIAWLAGVFAGVWVLFGHAGHWWAWLGVHLPTAFAASGLGYAAAAYTRPVNASVIALVATLVFAVFSGVEPQLAAVSPLPVVNWLWYLSYATWTAEATYVTWTGGYLVRGDARERMLAVASSYFGYDVRGGQGRSVAALLALGLAWRALAGYIIVKRARA